MRKRGVIAILLSALLLPPAAQAQSDPQVTDSKVGNFTLDLAVPESPAFTVLNLTPSTVSRPSSVQQLATSLLNGVDQNGNFQTGVALDFQPYMLMYGRLVTWNKYAAHYATRFASRTMVSVGTTKGASEADKSMRVALGVRLTVFDLGDPFRDQKTADCLAAAHSTALANVGLPVPPPKASQTTIDAYQAAKMKQLAPLETVCRVDQEERARKENWNNSSFIVAVAPTWTSPDGSSSNLSLAGAGYWTSLSYGFEGLPGMEDTSQFILHYRHRRNELIPTRTEGGPSFEQDSDTFGMRLRVGSANGTGSFEYAFNQRRVMGQPDDTSHRFAFAAERRISGNTWLTVSVGSEDGRADGAGGGFVLSSLAWSLNDRP